jgi:hypothetical protein
LLISLIESVPADSGLVKPDTYHPPLSTNVCLPHASYNLNCEFSYRIFAAGNYNLLYNILSTGHWSRVYETSSVNVALAGLNAVVRDATKKMSIPRGYNRKSTFPISTVVLKRNDQITFMTNSPSTESLLKTLSSLKRFDG